MGAKRNNKGRIFPRWYTYFVLTRNLGQHIVRFAIRRRKIQKKYSTASLLIFCANISAAIYQCGLERDIELFEAGDLTEVGEKGLTLRSVQ